MRSIILAILLLAPGLAWGGNLAGKEIINTQRYLCNSGKAYEHVWVNHTGRTLYVRKASLWSGMDIKGRADYHAQLNRVGDNAPLVRLAWDHYADPTGPHEVTQDFGTHYIKLLPKTAVKLSFFCVPVKGKSKIGGHHVVTLWWTLEP